MNIYDIKRATKKTAPHYFSKNTLAFFGQTMKDFKVIKMKSGKYIVQAPSYDQERNFMGYSLRIFDPATNELYTSIKTQYKIKKS